MTSSARSLRRTLAWPVLATLLAALAPASAHAQADADKTTARQLGQQGEAALASGAWQQADDDFRRADALFHAPTLVLGLARAQSHEGKFVEAWESYHRILQENVTSSPVFAQALRDAAAEMKSVEGRRSRLTLTVAGSAAPHVLIDSVPLKPEALGVERFANPGHHTIAVSADGFKDVIKAVNLVEGKAEVVAITLESAPIQPVAARAAAGAAQPVAADAGRSSLGRTLGIAGIAVGGAGLITGVVTGILALGDHGTLKTDCPTGTCTTSSSQSELSSYHTVGAVSTIGFIVGGVGVAGGAVLFFTAPKGAPTSGATGVTPYVGFGTVGAVGTF